MVQHVVLLSFPGGISDIQRDRVQELLAPFSQGIPGLARFHWGWDQSGRSREYQLALVMTFTDADSLAAYHPHPVHQIFAQWVAAEGAQVLAFDFPITE